MNPNEASFKAQLALAARSITSSLNSLLDVCIKSAPGQKECDNAVRTMQARFAVCNDHHSFGSALRLETCSTGLSEETYFDCLDSVMAHSKVWLAVPSLTLQALGAAMSGIATHARSGATDEFVNSGTVIPPVFFRFCFNRIYQKLKSAPISCRIPSHRLHFQSTQLLWRCSRCLTPRPRHPFLLASHTPPRRWSSRVWSTSPRFATWSDGPVHYYLQFSRAQASVTSACDALLSTSSSPAEIMEAAGAIAKNTSFLCGACKQASQGTRNAVAKKQFLRFAKEVVCPLTALAHCQIATSTSALVTVIRSLSQNPNAVSRKVLSHFTFQVLLRS